MFAFRSVFTEITEECLDVKHAIWEMYLHCCLVFTSVIWFYLWNTNIRQTKAFTVELKLKVIAEYLKKVWSKPWRDIWNELYQEEWGMGSPRVSFRSTLRMQRSSPTAEGSQPDPCTHTGKTTCPAGSAAQEVGNKTPGDLRTWGEGVLFSDILIH